ncbi:hypothetical protein B0A48_17223 [Cryoendolithus antarcticus]|uniref:Uncharacterized protein n=1 Tax=Cryoendolithus antarcticus TaxID=1507870 RepID=A0A1V8SDK8_9PEZI|nr:hypothetical protein B0A48_17223 [Cryoendolithus antarcticus]
MSKPPVEAGTTDNAEATTDEHRLHTKLASPFPDITSSKKTFDVYARSFIPYQFKSINDLPAVNYPSEGVTWIEFEDYVRTFAGSAFLPKDSSGVKVEDAAAKLARSELCAENYRYYFLDLLAREVDAARDNCIEHALYNVPLQRARNDPRPFMYWLDVPGLTESTLQIEVGDQVALRQLGAQYAPNVAPYGTTIQYDAVVWGIQRSHGRVTLRIDNLFWQSGLFNVSFSVQPFRIKALHTAVSKSHTCLSDDSDGWLRSILFPRPADGVMQRSLGNRRFHIKALDPLLNYEQLKAADTVVHSDWGTVPYLISGPPGTGKTKTLIELALQLLLTDSDAHLIVCAPSDPASDTLTSRLLPHLKPRELLRLHSPSRSFAEVPDSLLPYSCIDNGTFSLPSFADLMRLKILVVTCRDADLLRSARVSNRDLFHLERSMIAALHPGMKYPGKNDEVPKLHWTALLLDEAAQATEPEAQIPLNVVAPPLGEDNRYVTASPVVVMAGDQHQLGPRTSSKLPALQLSLFERLFQRPLYRDHPLARSSGTQPRLTASMLPMIRPPFTNLIRNYRSHTAILAVPSKLFYNDTLEPEASNTDSLLSWSGWHGARWPVLFAVNTASDEIERDGGGWYNVREANMAITYARSFLAEQLLSQREVCIMSPFAAQVKLLRRLAREAKLWDVNIGPLEAFQGLESRVVILCTTRTRYRFIEQDLAKGLGVIHERRRVNVALTRAKEGLVVIGNDEVLGNDEWWKDWLGFVARNGLWEAEKGASTQKGFGWGDGKSLGRLEKRLAMEDKAKRGEPGGHARELGIGHGADSRLWASGVAVENALRSLELVDAVDGHSDSA